MRAFLVLSLIALVGCAAPGTPIPTASGNPEIVIRAERPRIVSALVNAMAAKGYTPGAITEYQAEFAKGADLSRGMFGIEQTGWRVLFLSSPEGTRLSASMQMKRRGVAVWESTGKLTVESPATAEATEILMATEREAEAAR